MIKRLFTLLAFSLLLTSQAVADGPTPPPLNIEEEDGSPDVIPVFVMQVSNGSLTDDGNGQVSITTGGGGETNTASNVGNGIGVFKEKSGVDLRFKSIVSGDNITISQDANSIVFNLTAFAGGDVTNTAGSPILTIGDSRVETNDLSSITGQNTSAVVVGTAGATDDCAKWDANGNLVTHGSACGGGTPGGASTQIQYNQSNALSADTTLQWLEGPNTLVISTDASQVISTDAIIISSDTGAKLWGVSHDGSMYVGGTIESPGSGINSLRLGRGSQSVGTNSVVIGPQATNNGNFSVAIGKGSLLNTGGSNVAIGSTASITGAASSSVVIGQGASSSATGTVCIGNSASCTGTASIGIGSGVSVTTSNRMVIGANNNEINDVYIGEGVTNSAPPTLVALNTTGGSGSNIAGVALRVAAGKGTGNAAGGQLNLAISPRTTAGSTLQGITDVIELKTSIDTVTITPLNPAMVGLVISGDALQTAYLQEWSSSDGVTYGNVSPDGATYHTKIATNELDSNSISSDNGVIVLGGKNLTNNENLTFNFESAANDVNLSSTSGADDLVMVAGLDQKFEDGGEAKFGTGTDSALQFSTAGNDHLVLGIAVGTSSQSGYLIVTEYADRDTSWGQPTRADPVLRIQGADATDTSDYIEVHHNQTNAVIDVGNGNLQLSADLVAKNTISADKTTNIGWSVQTAANQACDTTCTWACVMGEDTSVVGTFTDCADTSSDKCLCAGPS